jgi:hypothetical protein
VFAEAVGVLEQTYCQSIGAEFMFIRDLQKTSWLLGKMETSRNTPVFSADPAILAKIGKKEGLKGGEKFDVLERTLNEKTGLTEYKKVGSATVDKKLVWDNRYNAGEEAEEKQLDKDGNPITATVFKGSKKIQPGMLLKFIK